MKRSDFFKTLYALPLISLFVKEKTEPNPGWKMYNNTIVPASVCSVASRTVHINEFRFMEINNSHITINGEWVTIRPLTPSEIFKLSRP